MAETVIQPNANNPRALDLVRQSFAEATLDNFTKPPAQSPDSFEALTDIEPVVDSRLNRRRGYTLLSNPTTAARRMFEAHFSTTGGTRNRILLTTADQTGSASKDNRVSVINENGDALGNIFTPAAAATVHPYMALSREYAYFLDGASADLKKWDGDESLPAGSLTDWGMSASGNVFTASGSGSGTITLEVGRRYLVAFLYNPTGHAVLYDISSSGTVEQKQTDSVDSGAVTDVAQIDLASLPVFTVGSTGLVSASMYRVILATADGGPLDTLYEVGRISDNTTTTFTDTKTENALLASPVWAEIGDDGRGYGIYDNTKPATTIPTATIVIPHRDRLYAITEQFLNWSKNLREMTTSTGQITGRYEECWPASNQEAVAIYSEFGRGLLSDGVRLYIATDRGVRYLLDPFAGPPKTLHQEVGLMRQDTWKLVYHGGVQVGSIWLTPDRRVIANDFNTYGDIGRPIQATLNNINVARARLCSHATFVTDGAYELYMLAVPAPGVETVTAHSGTAQAGGTTTTIVLAAGASATNDIYNSYTVRITGGTGSGQVGTITDYVGSTRTATITATTPWTAGPDATSTYTVKVPECDTLLVYDVQYKRWYIWYPAETDGTLGVAGYGLFSQAYLQDIVNNRSLWMFATNNNVGGLAGRVYRWHTGVELDTATNLRDRNTTTETPVTYDCTITTTWLDWGQPTVVKFLNDLEVITGDTGLTVAISGANTAAQFASPTAVLAATAVSASPFGNYRVALAAATPQKFRWYRFTFNSPAGTTRDLLDFLRIEAIPLTGLI